MTDKRMLELIYECPEDEEIVGIVTYMDDVILATSQCVYRIRKEQETYTINPLEIALDNEEEHLL